MNSGMEEVEEGQSRGAMSGASLSTGGGPGSGPRTAQAGGGGPGPQSRAGSRRCAACPAPFSGDPGKRRRPQVPRQCLVPEPSRRRLAAAAGAAGGRQYRRAPAEGRAAPRARLRPASLRAARAVPR